MSCSKMHERCSSDGFKRSRSACNAGLRVLRLPLCRSVSCRVHYGPRFDNASWNLTPLSAAVLCDDSFSSMAYLSLAPSFAKRSGSLSRIWLVYNERCDLECTSSMLRTDARQHHALRYPESPVAVAESIGGTMHLQRIDMSSWRALAIGRFRPVDSGIDVCTGCRLRTASHIQCRIGRERNSRYQHHDRADRHGHDDRVSLSLFSNGWVLQASGKQRSNRFCMMLCIKGSF